MKRCLQCDFTFEDNQEICDFDGTELVPEPDPFSKNVSPNISPSLAKLGAVPASPFRRFAHSRVSLTALVLAGLISSALLIGYYDSATQPDIDLVSNAESGSDKGNLVPQSPSEKSEQAKLEPVAKTRSISTQRKIRANEKTSSMPASMLKLESAAARSSRSRTASRPGPTARREATSATGTVVSKRSRARAQRESLARGRRRSSHVEVIARNQKRPGPSRVRESASARQKRHAKLVAVSRGREAQSAHEQKDSKFVAILKKTGRILKRPFEF